MIAKSSSSFLGVRKKLANGGCLDAKASTSTLGEQVANVNVRTMCINLTDHTHVQNVDALNFSQTFAALVAIKCGKNTRPYMRQNRKELALASRLDKTTIH